MKIKMSYNLPYTDLTVFDHLKSNRLDVTIDTATLEGIDDLPGKIVDEILRMYSICISRFDESRIPSWDRIVKTANSAILERKYCEACEKVTNFREMRNMTIRKMNDILSDAEADASQAHAAWINSLTGSEP